MPFQDVIRRLACQGRGIWDTTGQRDPEMQAGVKPWTARAAFMSRLHSPNPPACSTTHRASLGTVNRLYMSTDTYHTDKDLRTELRM